MVFTIAGRNNIRDYLAGDSPTPPSHIGWGEDNTAPNESDTQLVDETLRDSVDTTNTSGSEVELTNTLGLNQGNGAALKELGLFNASTSGTMFSRSTFVTIDKDNTVSIKAIIKVMIL